MRFQSLCLLLLCLEGRHIQGFLAVSPPAASALNQCSSKTSCRAGKGFGKASSSSSSSPSSRPRKTYGRDSIPSRDVIDVESAMKDFFSTRQEWMPLFRTLACTTTTTCQAVDYLGGHETIQTSHKIDFHETSSPWKRLGGIPEVEEDRTVLATFLDDSQKSLIAIPVDEQTEEDDNDMQFVEEGRRLLALNRFHVLRENHGGTVEHMDAIFSTCWSELMHLSDVDEEHTGSLILLPDYKEISDLRRFTDMNVLQPLEWLGIHTDFEVTSFRRGQSPAVRILYKLNDIPEPQETEEEEEEEEESSE